MIKLIGIGIKLIGMIKQARPFSSLLPLFSLSRLLSLFSGALLSVFSCKYCSSLYSLSPHVSLLSLSLSLISLFTVPGCGGESEKDAKLAQKLAQLQP